MNKIEKDLEMNLKSFTFVQDECGWSPAFPEVSQNKILIFAGGSPALPDGFTK